ncbi:hypothetical protein AABB24_015706 [Solanum stoloniferum]|uniref:DUF4216 domain-containing protein n=1 Tax=Solanum stoloniferum TaxID=62892 RepID=A0ABD2TR41_9SOLN
MHCTDTSSDVYLKGVDNFLQFAFQNSEVEGEIPDFARYPRNVRLGLASDGVNPFGNLSVSHSIWPVIITVYNLSPWMCMKQPYCYLSLLIPGPKAPGNNSGNGVKIDKHDYVSVNTKRKIATNEPFVLASQVEQIFYVKDNLHPNWSIVLNGHSSYFTGGAIDEETFQQDDCNDFSHGFEDDEDFINWKRNYLDVISTYVTVADDITEDNESESEANDEVIYFYLLLRVDLNFIKLLQLYVN